LHAFNKWGIKKPEIHARSNPLAGIFISRSSAMAAGHAMKVPKTKPRMEKAHVLNEVARGSGRSDPFGRDGSGSNKAATALDSKGIKSGKQPPIKMIVNSGHDSPVGKERPAQSGGPRTGQTSGIDRDVKHFPVQGNDHRGAGRAGMHGHKPGRGSENRFDLYSEARSGDKRFPKD
jgi:hypothetical protein